MRRMKPTLTPAEFTAAKDDGIEYGYRAYRRANPHTNEPAEFTSFYGPGWAGNMTDVDEVEPVACKRAIDLARAEQVWLEPMGRTLYEVTREPEIVRDLPESLGGGDARAHDDEHVVLGLRAMGRDEEYGRLYRVRRNRPLYVRVGVPSHGPCEVCGMSVLACEVSEPVELSCCPGCTHPRTHDDPSSTTAAETGTGG